MLQVIKLKERGLMNTLKLATFFLGSDKISCSDDLSAYTYNGCHTKGVHKVINFDLFKPIFQMASCCGLSFSVFSPSNLHLTSQNNNFLLISVHLTKPVYEQRWLFVVSIVCCLSASPHPFPTTQNNRYYPYNNSTNRQA